MAHQLRTISSRRLGQRIGRLADLDLQKVLREAIRVYLDLD